MGSKKMWKNAFILSFIFLFAWFILSLIIFGYIELIITITFEIVIIIGLVSFCNSMIVIDFITER